MDQFTASLSLLGLAEKLCRLVLDVDESLRSVCCITGDTLPQGLTLAREWKRSIDESEQVLEASFAASKPVDGSSGSASTDSNQDDASKVSLVAGAATQGRCAPFDYF
jgi:hypothetical protein